jgi:hypothetical protein
MTYVRRVYDIYKKRESSKQKSPDSNARTPLRESLTALVFNKPHCE